MVVVGDSKMGTGLLARRFSTSFPGFSPTRPYGARVGERTWERGWTFLSDPSQPEVEFFSSWAVVLPEVDFFFLLGQ